MIRRLTKLTLQLAVAALCEGDPDLERVVSVHGVPPLWARQPGYSTLVRIILEQQVSLASANAVYRRLRTAVGVVSPEAVMRIGPQGLRRLGFTSQKSGYAVDMAREILAGRLSLTAIARADDEEARRRLCAIRGIGPWSADVYRLMALRRPDVWPDGDLALSEAARRIKRLKSRPGVERLRDIAEPWAPWRSVAARILWNYYINDPTRAGSGRA